MENDNLDDTDDVHTDEQKAIWTEVNFLGPLTTAPEDVDEGFMFLDLSISNNDEQFMRIFSNGEWSEPILI